MLESKVSPLLIRDEFMHVSNNSVNKQSPEDRFAALCIFDKY